MSTRSIRLVVVLALLCSLLPQTALRADVPSTAPQRRLETLLIAHDVRYAIQLPRANASDCLHTEAERGR